MNGTMKALAVGAGIVAVDAFVIDTKFVGSVAAGSIGYWLAGGWGAVAAIGAVVGGRALVRVARAQA